MLKLPAIAPEAASIPISNDEAYVREKGELLHPNCKDKKVLDEAKETLGSHGFQAQYQQDPVPVPPFNPVRRRNPWILEQWWSAITAPTRTGGYCNWPLSLERME